MNVIRSIVLVAALSLTASCGHAQSESDMAELGSALTKLSRAVSTAARSPSYQNADGEGLLRAVGERDPSLIQPFRGLVLRVNRIGSASAVLVCDAQGTRALLEDSGCTAPLDTHRYRSPEPCEFSLSVQQVCN